MGSPRTGLSSAASRAGPGAAGPCSGPPPLGLLLPGGGPAQGRRASGGVELHSTGALTSHAFLSPLRQPISSLLSSSTTQESCWPQATRVAGSSSSSGNPRCDGAWWVGGCILQGATLHSTRVGPWGSSPAFPAGSWGRTCLLYTSDAADDRNVV